MVREVDLRLGDGRTLHVYEGDGDRSAARLDVLWHHGTSNTGALPEPLLQVAVEHGMRFVSYDRPGYGSSTPRPGRDLASAAADASAVADALGIDDFVVMGHSGGANHALACAALLPGRVRAAVCAATLAPLHSQGLNWFEGMGAHGAALLQAAEGGR